MANCENTKKLRVGGQAVMEGVMMKGPEKTAVAVRREDGLIEVHRKHFSTPGEKHKIFTVPVIRGVANFIVTLVMGMQTLMKSADIAGEDLKDETSKFERFLSEKLHIDIMDVVIGISLILGCGLAIGLFIVVPTLIARLFGLFFDSSIILSLIEGITKMGIFVAYIVLVSKMNEINRVFMYHGAEHKVINCYENDLELTPENAKTCSREHMRCGTSFLIIVLVVSIFVSVFITWKTALLRMVIKLLLLPVIAGVCYEIIMFAGAHQGKCMRIIMSPGLAMQKLTTKEPELDMLQVSIAAFKGAVAPLEGNSDKYVLTADGTEIYVAPEEEPAAEEEESEGNAPV